jgi:hypothetical protein
MVTEINSGCHSNREFMRFDFLTDVKIFTAVFSVLMLLGSVDRNQRFGATYRLHLQNWYPPRSRHGVTNYDASMDENRNS